MLELLRKNSSAKEGKVLCTELRAKVLSIALLMSSVAYGQSLGDVAKENREKQKAKAAPLTANQR